MVPNRLHPHEFATQLGLGSPRLPCRRAPLLGERDLVALVIDEGTHGAEEAAPVEDREARPFVRRQLGNFREKRRARRTEMNVYARVGGKIPNGLEVREHRERRQGKNGERQSATPPPSN